MRAFFLQIITIWHFWLSYIFYQGIKKYFVLKRRKYIVFDFTIRISVIYFMWYFFSSARSSGSSSVCQYLNSLSALSLTSLALSASASSFTSLYSEYTSSNQRSTTYFVLFYYPQLGINFSLCECSLPLLFPVLYSYKSSLSCGLVTF